jgi:hypothetical protein
MQPAAVATDRKFRLQAPKRKKPKDDQNTELLKRLDDM